MNLIDYYHNNPYYACFYDYKYYEGYNGFKGNIAMLKEASRYFELIKKIFKYVYGYELQDAINKIKKYVAIGDRVKAEKLSNEVNDFFYLWQYIHIILWDKVLYSTPTCREKAIIDCLKNYWKCKKVNIMNVLNEFELLACKDDGVDYMIIIDPTVNPTATPPNQVK